MNAKTAKKPAKAKATSSPAKVKKKPAPPAKSAPKTAPKAVAKVKKTSAAKPVKQITSKSNEAKPFISNDEIATRAYYIGERRQRMGWPGDPSSDWIEAEVQLVAEAKRKKSS